MLRLQQEHDLDNPEKILATSGESFFWARRFLGKKMGHDAAVLYSFCRVLDDMADGDLPDGFEHLSTIQASLEKGEWNDHALLRHHAPMVNEYNLPKDVIASLVEGLMDDQADEVLLPDEESLIQYAYKVAGTVGLLMCEILNNSDPKAKPHAVDLGIAMQLTNIARDVVEDARMGRRYLPGSWVGNMSPEDILDAALDPYGPDGVQITRAVERLLDLAESYYASGRAGLAYLPARAHFSIGVPQRSTGKSVANCSVPRIPGTESVRSRQREARCSAPSGRPLTSLGAFLTLADPTTLSCTPGSSRTCITAVAGDGQRCSRPGGRRCGNDARCPGGRTRRSNAFHRST